MTDLVKLWELINTHFVRFDNICCHGFLLWSVDVLKGELEEEEILWSEDQVQEAIWLKFCLNFKVTQY